MRVVNVAGSNSSILVGIKFESFGLIWQNLNFICIIGTVESYLELWFVRKESKFRYHYCQNSTKSMREKKKKGGERKCWISVMWIPKFLCQIPVAWVWSVCGVRKVKRKKKIVTIVAMPLSKMGGKK